MEQGVFRFGACELDERSRELRREGRLQHLEPQVFDVLAYLIRHRDRVVPKAELLDEVWGSRFVGESALTSRIKSARQAVGDSGRDQAALRTVHGRGYRFVAPVDDTADGAVSSAPPALEGRALPLERLERRFAEAEVGRRRTVLVTGEAGIGKTALTEAFVERLDAHGALVARGRCQEPRGAAEPYLAVFEALSRLCRGPDAVEVTDVLGAAAPSWLLQMPSVLPQEGLDELRARSVGASSQRMLRELVDAIETLAARRPVVFLLEDMHWSDGPTAGLFEWLARRRDPARLLLVGTCRPGSTGSEGFGAVASALMAGRDAEEVPLQRLDRAEVERLLDAWVPGLAGSMATFVHDRTEGVPLFVRDLLSSWVDSGVVARDQTGRWTLTGALDDLARTVPPSVQVLVERDLARLSAEDVDMLEGASVAGVEFTSAVVAGATGQSDELVEARCTALARRGLLVAPDGAERWADGTVSARFRFLHQLHHQVLYERVPPVRRSRYHLAVGGRLEKAYGGQRDEHVGELAVHFDRAGDAPRAVGYLRRTAELALVRGAHAEALGHLDAALRHVAAMPDGEGRARAELVVHMTRGSALIVTHGWAAPDVEAAYRRAAELCRSLGDPPEAQVVTVGLAAMEEMRGRHLQSEALLEPQLEAGPTLLVLETYELLACSAFHQGRFEKAIDRAVRGLAHHRPEAPNELYASHGVDPAVLCRGWAAFSSWFLGDSASAVRHIEEGRAAAGAQPYAVASAAVDSASLHHYRDEPEEVLDQAEAAVAVATEHGYPFRLVQARIMRGWAQAALGHGDDGLTELRAGLDGYRSIGAFVEWPHYLGMLADVLVRTGRAAEALEHLAEALAATAATPGYFFEPELHRLRARALLAAGHVGAVDEARAALRRGLELADAQGSAAGRLRLLLAARELAGDGADGYELRGAIQDTLSGFPEDDRAPDLVRARAV